MPDSNLPKRHQPARRTILGAAWATPVIMSSAALPALASSTPLAILFDSTQSSANVNATYGAITGRVSGAASPQTVTLTLPAGWTWVGSAGSTRTVTTTATGEFSLPAGSIKAPTVASSATIVATAPTATTAMHTLIATALAGTFYLTENNANGNSGNVINVYTASGAMVRSLTTSARFWGVVMSADHSTLYVVYSGSIYHLDPATGAVINVVGVGSLLQNTIGVTSLLPDGALLISIALSPTLYRVDPNTGATSVYGSLPGQASVMYGSDAAIVLPDGRLLSSRGLTSVANSSVYSRIFVGSTLVSSGARSDQNDFVQIRAFTNLNGTIYAVSRNTGLSAGVVFKVNVVGDSVTFTRMFLINHHSWGIAA